VTLNPASKEETKFFITLMMSRWNKDEGDYYDPEDPRAKGVRDILLEVKEELVEMMEEKGELSGPSNTSSPLAQQEETTMEEETKDKDCASSEKSDDEIKTNTKRKFVIPDMTSGMASGMASGYLPSITFPIFVRDLFAVTSEMDLTPDWKEDGNKPEHESPFDGAIPPPPLPFAESVQPSLRMNNDPSYLNVSTGLPSVEMVPAILTQAETTQGNPLLLSVEIEMGKKGRDITNNTFDNVVLSSGLITNDSMGSSSVEMGPSSEAEGMINKSDKGKPQTKERTIPLKPREDWMREGDDRSDVGADADWIEANTLVSRGFESSNTEAKENRVTGIRFCGTCWNWSAHEQVERDAKSAQAQEHKREEEDYRRSRIILANTRKALLEGLGRDESKGEKRIP
jgi:hypothetical protein